MINFYVTFKEQINRFDATFSETLQSFVVGFNETSQKVDVRVDGLLIVTEGGGTCTEEIYEGDYNVVPKVEGQKLFTANKHMIDDVTITSIPYYEVSNASGGNTVYIAKEI